MRDFFLSNSALGLLPFIVTIGLGAWIFRLHTKIKRIEQKKAKLENMTLEDVNDMLGSHDVRIQESQQDIKDLYRVSKKLHSQILNCLQDSSVVRFNPFQDTGGDQSFSLALLNKRGDGLVISSLHNRSGTRVYSKPIQKGVSRFELTNEEIEAIARAAHIDLKDLDKETERKEARVD